MSVQDADHNEARGRQSRAEVNAGNRRRRRGGTLNRMAQFKLDCFEPHQLETDKYVYRWVNDEPGKIRAATAFDDYDFVPTTDLKDFDVSKTDSESDGRVRMFAGKDQHGNPLYTYLVRKPKEFWVEDNEASVRAREDMMAGRIHDGDVGNFDGSAQGIQRQDGSDPTFYVSGTTQIGHGGERRRGPVKR